MQSTGDIGDVPVANLQSAYRQLEPMTWRRGAAHFEDPNGRPISLSRVNASSVVALDDAESYVVPAGIAEASSLALDLVALSTNPTEAPLRALSFVQRWGLLRAGPDGPRRESWDSFLVTSGSLMKVVALATAVRVGTAESDPYWTWIKSQLSRPDLDSSSYVAAIVTNGMVDCETRLVPAGPDKFGWSARCLSLAGRAHYEAGVLLAGRSPLRECQAGGCGRLFILEDPRMLFCSPRCREREKKRRSRAVAKKKGASS